MLLLQLAFHVWCDLSQESTLVEGCDPNAVPEKALQEKEKALLEKFKLVLQAFLHEQTDLQVVAVYALQVYCYSLHFPKGNVRLVQLNQSLKKGCAVHMKLCNVLWCGSVCLECQDQ